MELETAARKMLLDDPTVAGYVQTKVYKHRLMEEVSGTGGRAVVLRRDRGWSIADHFNTQEYPRLIVDCWADCSRDADGNIAASDAEDNAWALYRATDPLLDAQGEAIWGARDDNPGLIVLGSQRLGEPALITRYNVAASFAVQLGDCAYVSTEYGLIVMHGEVAV